MKPKVLLVDDDVELVELLSDYLAQAGFIVTAAHDGATGAAMALTRKFDIVVLDVMMPGMNGIQVLGRIRSASVVPVVMLTARGDDADRVHGLELGADDYVPKPCTPRELVARIRAILKRTRSGLTPSPEPIVVGNLTVWPAQRRAEREGKPLDLTSTEFNLVEVLALNAGRLVTRDELSRKALGRPLTRFDRTIDVHMSGIRQKLGRLADGRSLVQTVIRKGYQLVVER
jgi:two-component system, OmpR family, response regulator